MHFNPPTQDQMDLAVLEFQGAKRQLAQAQEQFDKAQEALVAIMMSRGYKTHTYEDTKVTLVQNELLSFDDKGLRKALGARVFNKLTTAKLDRKKLEKAVEDGQVDPIVVAQYAQAKLGSAYVRATEKK